jgi:hypothetical protein
MVMVVNNRNLIGLKFGFVSLSLGRQKEGGEPMSNQNDSFFDILSEAYEKGENEQGMTVQELVKDL